jgi:hypothetical protein
MRLFELRENGRKARNCEILRCPHAHLAAQRSFPQHALRPLIDCKDVTGHLKHCRSGRRHAKCFGRANQKHLPDGFLKARHMLADRGLLEVEPTCGPAESFLFGDGDKAAQENGMEERVRTYHDMRYIYSIYHDCARG